MNPSDLPLIRRILDEGPIRLSGGHDQEWSRHRLARSRTGYLYSHQSSDGDDERIALPDFAAVEALFAERPGLGLSFANHLADRLRLERELGQWVAEMRAGRALSHTIDLSRSLGGSATLRLEAVGEGFRYTYRPRRGQETVEELADVDALRAFLKSRRDVLQYL